MTDTITQHGANRISRSRLRTETEQRTVVRAGRISVDKIRLHKCNTSRDHGDLRGLMASIRSQGLDGPITVQQHQGWYEVVDGARRLLAVRMLGQRTIVAIIRAPRPDDEVLAATVATDIHKKPMTRAERGRVVRQMQKADWAVPDMAAYWGVAESTIYGWLAEASADEPQPPGEPPARIPSQRRSGPKWKTHVNELRRRWESQIGDHGLNRDQAVALLTELAELAGKPAAAAEVAA